MIKSRYIGDGHPTFNRNPYNGYINPYYWVDDHPLLYGNNESLDPGKYTFQCNFRGFWSAMTPLHLEMLQQHTQALAGRKNNHHGHQWMMSYRCFTIKVWPERFRSRLHPPGNFRILEILHGITGKSPQIGWVKMDTANKSTLLVSVFSLFGRWPIKLADLPNGSEIQRVSWGWGKDDQPPKPEKTPRIWGERRLAVCLRWTSPPSHLPQQRLPIWWTDWAQIGWMERCELGIFANLLYRQLEIANSSWVT